MARGSAAAGAALALCVAAAVLAIATAHTCVHDTLPRAAHVVAPQQYDAHAHDASVDVDERRRRLVATVWEPIRIKVRAQACVGEAVG